MRTYLSFSLKSFSSNLAYRSEVWLRIVSNFVAIFIQVAIWDAVIGESHVDGITLPVMITYSILNTLIASLLLTQVSSGVSSSLRSGSIATELIRPLSYPVYLFANGMGGVLYRIVFVAVPSLLAAWIFFDIERPASLFHLLAFIAGLIIALGLSFMLGYLISLLSFWLLTHFALDWTLAGIITVFSGSFLPLWFFPDSWAAIAHALPFQFLGYIPAALYLGYIPVGEIVWTLLLGAAWLLFFGLINQVLWWRAVRRLVVQGG